MRALTFLFACGILADSGLSLGFDGQRERQPTFLAAGQGDTKVQMSFQQELVERSSVFFAYTLQGIWLRDVPSAPFKELTHRPEIYWNSFLGDLGYAHESNGLDNRSTDYEGQSHRSRSLQHVFWQNFRLWQLGSFAGGFKVMAPVYVKKPTPYHDYVGVGEAEVSYQGRNTSLEVRARSGRKGGRLLSHISLNPLLLTDSSWSQRNHLWLFAEYFRGYGETLIDYNRFSTSLRLGFRLHL